MDRFVTPDGSSEANEVGSCEACGGVVYDYESTSCPSCQSHIHTGCKKKCSVCGSQGCRTCLAQDPDSQDWICENCMLEILESENKN